MPFPKPQPIPYCKCDEDAKKKAKDGDCYQYTICDDCPVDRSSWGMMVGKEIILKKNYE